MSAFGPKNAAMLDLHRGLHELMLYAGLSQADEVWVVMLVLADVCGDDLSLEDARKALGEAWTFSAKARAKTLAAHVMSAGTGEA